MIYMAEVVYKNIGEIKRNNPCTSNIQAIETFMGSEIYDDISSGKFHDSWFKNLKKNDFIDKNSGKQIPDETIKLLEMQKDITMKQLLKYPR